MLAAAGRRRNQSIGVQNPSRWSGPWTLVDGYRGHLVVSPPSDVDDKLDWLFAESEPTVHCSSCVAKAGRTGMNEMAINARMVSSFMVKPVIPTRPRECGAVRER